MVIAVLGKVPLIGSGPQTQGDFYLTLSLFANLPQKKAPNPAVPFLLLVSPRSCFLHKAPSASTEWGKGTTRRAHTQNILLPFSSRNVGSCTYGDLGYQHSSLCLLSDCLC